MLAFRLSGRRLTVLLALAAAVLALAAVPAVASGGKSVKVGDFFFHPGRMTIRRGTKVTWNWVGFIGHNVTVKKGPARFHSKTQVKGSYSHVFRKKGTYVLYCTVHPTLMKETIVVK
jgi:plastocyanin